MHCAGAALRDSGAHPTESIPDAEVAVGAAGPALYLVGQVLVRLRLLGCIYWVRLGGAVACILVGVLGAAVPGLLLEALLVGVLVAVIALEQSGATRRGLRRGAVLGRSRRRSLTGAGSTIRAS